MILLVLCVCLAAELHQSEGSLSQPDALGTISADQLMEIIDLHNALRRNVDPPAKNMLKMSWNEEAAANAQAWADECTLNHSPKARRVVGRNQCGENLFMSSGPSNWTNAIISWYNENKFFKHGVGATPEGAVIGHYTQMAWYSTYKMGCGSAYCPNQPTFKYYYVCHYCPAGNIQGRIATPYEKGPPCGACPNDCEDGLCTNPCKFRSEYPNCDQLVADWGCDHPMLSKNCEASCKCTTEIR
ncbi:serotriflin-like [Sphaerodactylus townsendi]|uniref:serotriflin-like n=1 Tax=Sphaerodactylus townsendi TaxID=933632 RepID=UPI0020272F3C|nr:serotriflin-like [Sphaerodactylus townsendi]